MCLQTATGAQTMTLLSDGTRHSHSGVITSLMLCSARYRLIFVVGGVGIHLGRGTRSPPGLVCA
jgi:hypothetical protein